MHPITYQQPSLHVSPAQEEPPSDHDYSVSRSTSVTSTLDPYYFGIGSPTDSPLPPLPSATLGLTVTPEQRNVVEPVTPARDPAAIDRRGLVGVGELTTPRWTRAEYQQPEPPLPVPEKFKDAEDYQVVAPEDAEEDPPDSPWTIEAVDGEPSEKEDVRAPRPLSFFLLTDNISRIYNLFGRFAVNLQLQTRVVAKRFCTLGSLLLHSPEFRLKCRRPLMNLFLRQNQKHYNK